MESRIAKPAFDNGTPVNVCFASTESELQSVKVQEFTFHRAGKMPGRY